LSAGGLIIPRMINMNESGPTTIAQVEEFLSASALIEFNPGVGGPLGLVGAVSVKSVVLTWQLAQMNFLTIRGQPQVGARVKSASAPTESGRKKFRRQSGGGCKKKARLN